MENKTYRKVSIIVTINIFMFMILTIAFQSTTSYPAE